MPLPQIRAEDNDDEQGRRTIRGRAVPWEVEALTSTGQKVTFAKDSISMAEAPIMLHHDPTRLAGVVVSETSTDDGLDIVAKISAVRDGDEALVLAGDRVLQGWSVGVNPKKYDEVPPQTEGRHDAFLFDQGPTKGLGSIQFHDPMLAYGPVALPNVEIFKRQIESLKALLVSCPPDAAQARDMDFLLAGGELFTLVAYGQLILESAALQGIDDELIDQIFDFMVRDFSRHALALYSTTSTKPEQAERCLKMIHRPDQDTERFESVWKNHVMTKVEAYEMTP